MIYSLALLSMGILAAFTPVTTAAGTGWVLGVGLVLVLVGLLGFVAMAAEGSGAGLAWRALWSAAAALGGACVLLHPWAGVLSLTLVLGASLVLQGTSAAMQGLLHRRRFGQGWRWLSASGLLMVSLGALVLAWSPTLGLILPSLFLALNLITYGAGAAASTFDAKVAAATAPSPPAGR